MWALVVAYGRINSYRLYGKKDDENLRLPEWVLKDKSESSVVKFVELNSKAYVFMDFGINMSPFTVINYDR
jgi:hypothetical protein